MFIFFFETSSQLKVWQAIGASFFPRRWNDRSVHFLSYPFGASTSSSFHLYSLLQRVQVNVLHRTCSPKWQRLKGFVFFDNPPGASNAVDDQNTFQNPSRGLWVWKSSRHTRHATARGMKHPAPGHALGESKSSCSASAPSRRPPRGCRLVKGNGATPPARVRTGRREASTPWHPCSSRACTAC